MKKSDKTKSKESKSAAKLKANNTQSEPTASPEIKPIPMERARQRVEEARKAAVSRVVSGKS